ncbi:cytochrome P450 [Trametes cingulata]|nr:cytochrome P450 [Trametes cingulata]
MTVVHALLVPAAILLVLTCWSARRAVRSSPVPAGPPRFPLVGNAFQLPVERPWEKFAEWSKQYGDMVYLRVFNRSIIVLNSIEAAIELQDKRASVYSDRPRRVMAESGYGLVTTFRVRYDEAVKSAKKYLSSGFNKAAVQSHAVIQEEAARILCGMLRDDPERFLDHLREITISTIRTIVYGTHLQSSSTAAYEELLRDVLAQFTKMASPSKYLVDTFPILRYVPAWFPGAQFQREAAHNRSQIDRFMTDPFMEVKTQLVRTIERQSFLSSILRKEQSSTGEEETIKFAAGSAFGAGFETTVALLSAFFMAMVLNPSAQSRAQEEIDRVVGRGNTPGSRHRASLPFVECIIAEVLRWRPPVPFAWRCSRVDDQYRGYTIPAGTLVTVNVRGLTHNSSSYPCPDDFKPERFMDPEGKYSTQLVPDPRRFVFGFGRRSCPGVHVADSFLYIVIVTVLASFTISPALDEDGRHVLPDSNYSSGLGGICQPPPFKCRIVPRC